MLSLIPLLILAQTPFEQQLLNRIAALEARIAALEAERQLPAPAAVASPPKPEAPVTPPATTINLFLDTYYGYNFNRPASRTNQLRAYDPTHNGFTVNQATLIAERATSRANRRYVGGRVDLQFGQATSLLQGSPANEPRPGVYQHIFQAYGSLLLPFGEGLQLDFGKFAGSLGIEGNYAKDQFNYSRNYFFNYLPFYHTGLRATYPVNSRFTATYWLVNGPNQTEDFNNFKSQAAILNFTPHRTLSGNLNYFTGRESPNGLPGRFQVLDTYWTWRPTSRLTLAGELDSISQQVPGLARLQRVRGGAAYAQYRLNPRWALGSRFTRFHDQAGLFTGFNQRLSEFTLTSTFDLVPGFQMRWEYRQDHASQPFFETARPQSPVTDMRTALLGLIWYFGPKTGAW